MQILLNTAYSPARIVLPIVDDAAMPLAPLTARTISGPEQTTIQGLVAAGQRLLRDDPAGIRAESGAETIATLPWKKAVVATFQAQTLATRQALAAQIPPIFIPLQAGDTALAKALLTAATCPGGFDGPTFTALQTTLLVFFPS